MPFLCILRGKSGLNEVMSIDRIAEIKRKIMTRKRGTIKGGEDYNPEVPQVVVSVTINVVFVQSTGLLEVLILDEEELKKKLC